jgi:ABC-type multidrug transport system fused ATPase/permease subunit
VLRVIERGTTSIETLFNTVVFSIGPTLFDVGTVCVVFISYGELYQAAIVFVTILLYCILTWLLTEWRTKFRQQQNEADNRSDQKAIDSLLNFETVKYFTGEEMEARQYAIPVTCALAHALFICDHSFTPRSGTRRICWLILMQHGKVRRRCCCWTEFKRCYSMAACYLGFFWQPKIS